MGALEGWSLAMVQGEIGDFGRWRGNVSLIRRFETLDRNPDEAVVRKQELHRFPGRPRLMVFVAIPGCSDLINTFRLYSHWPSSAVRIRKATRASLAHTLVDGSELVNRVLVLSI